VVWVLVSHCAYEVTPLAPIQAALPPETPLDDMSEPKKKAALKSPLLDVGQQPLQGGPVQIGAATAAIIIMPGQHGPAFLPLAEYVGPTLRSPVTEPRTSTALLMKLRYTTTLCLEEAFAHRTNRLPDGLHLRRWLPERRRLGAAL